MTLTAFLLTAAGLALLFVGGELLLRGAVAIALRSGLSPMLIGLTIVAFATSMPELLVTVTAGLGGVTDIGVGNVVGSNIANILLILGAAALIRPIVVHSRIVLRDASAVVLASALFILFALMGDFSSLHGAVMIALLVTYVWISYRWELNGNGSEAVEAEVLDEAEKVPGSLPKCLLILAAGLGGLCLGSDFLIDGAVVIARAAGVSETVIGLTLVAFGTSLPELATAIVAGLRDHTDVTLGNVLGSNIFNILLIIGVLAMMTPFAVAEEVMSFDIWVMAGVSVLVIPVMLSQRRIGRIEGLVFIALYLGFVVYQFDPGRAVQFAG